MRALHGAQKSRFASYLNRGRCPRNPRPRRGAEGQALKAWPSARQGEESLHPPQGQAPSGCSATLRSLDPGSATEDRSSA